MTNNGMEYTKKHYINKNKLQRMLPKGTHHTVTDEIIDLIHNMEKDTGLFQEYMEESLLSNLPVLKSVRVSLLDYVNAIKYCNLKKSMTNEKAWEIVFPDKYKKLLEEGKQVSNHVAMYNSSKIVTKIDAQMMVDIKIQYAPILHKALMKQVRLMDDPDVSFHVQHLASKTLIETLKPNEEQQVSLKIGQSDEMKESQEKMFSELKRVAEQQQALLRAGHKIEDIQKLNLTIDVLEEEEEDYVDIDDDDDDTVEGTSTLKKFKASEMTEKDTNLFEHRLSMNDD